MEGLHEWPCVRGQWSWAFLTCQLPPQSAEEHVRTLFREDLTHASDLGATCKRRAGVGALTVRISDRQADKRGLPAQDQPSRAHIQFLCSCLCSSICHIVPEIAYLECLFVPSPWASQSGGVLSYSAYERVHISVCNLVSTGRAVGQDECSHVSYAGGVRQVFYSR